MAILVQVLASIALLPVVHELGHFLAARCFGVRVAGLQIFFQPGFALLPAVRIGGTELRLGWLPLGAYVKLASPPRAPGKPLPEPPFPWELRSKPAWQRLVFFLAGVAVNGALGAALLYWGPESFRLVGQLSLAMAAMNLIPLPPLDGFRVALVLREMALRGRDPRGSVPARGAGRARAADPEAPPSRAP